MAHHEAISSEHKGRRDRGRGRQKGRKGEATFDRRAASGSIPRDQRSRDTRCLAKRNERVCLLGAQWASIITAVVYVHTDRYPVILYCVNGKLAKFADCSQEISSGAFLLCPFDASAMENGQWTMPNAQQKGQLFGGEPDRTSNLVCFRLNSTTTVEFRKTLTILTACQPQSSHPGSRRRPWVVDAVFI